MNSKKLLAVFGAVLMTSSTFVLPVLANNVDTPFSGYTCTLDRAKENDTYTYVYNKGSNPATIKVLANGVNTTRNGSAVIPANSQRFVSQYVYELGYRSCYLEIDGNTFGVWSPDSVGRYPVAN